MDKPPTQEEKRNPKYCLYHKKVIHSTADCYAVRRVYHSKVNKGEIVKTQKADINPFPKHDEKGQVMTCTAVKEIEPAEKGKAKIDESEGSDVNTEFLIKSKVFKTLFDTLEFSEEARNKAVQAILEVSNEY
ncbi:hypothetical protein TorRG33x02_248730 [Trema orientale]|uniref:Uncharacterized protein n=1 Tax=Trema orientale TaxID=63057 RepID=A0A2P5DKI3_TREOI|nr:hypothetical protein TorRG33x02_248730 [Trema orientale]